MGYKEPLNISYIIGSAPPTDPADSDNRYFGAYPNLAMTTTAAARRLYIAKKGTIRNVFFSFYCSTGTAGTNENIVAAVRLNNTTDYALATVAISNVVRLFSNENMAIPVNIGDYIEIKITCPIWATNPLQVQLWGLVVQDI